MSAARYFGACERLYAQTGAYTRVRLNPHGAESAPALFPHAPVPRHRGLAVRPRRHDLAQRQQGRRDLLDQLHAELSTLWRLIEVEVEVEAARSASPRLRELVIVAHSRYREILADIPDGPVAPWGSRAASVARAAGVDFRLTGEADRLSAPDADLARLALSDLVGNAVQAGARTVDAELQQAAGLVVLRVSDDGRPLISTTWQQPGSSSRWLADRLADRNGSLLFEDTSGTKVVEARWDASRSQ